MSRRRSPAVAGALGISWCCWPPCRPSSSIRPAVHRRRIDLSRRIHRGGRAQALQRGPHRRRQGRQGHVRRTRRRPCGRRLQGVKDAWVGNETSASIQIKTILGQKYLALDPRGSDTLNPSDMIPLDRTTSPYDVIEAFSAAAQTVGDIDSDQLAQSMVTLSQAFEGTPTEIRASLDGVTQAVADHRQPRSGTAEVVRRDRQDHQGPRRPQRRIHRLIGDAGLLLGELNSRQQSISQLLTGTQRLSQQLTGLVQATTRRNRSRARTARGVVEILQANNENLDRAMKLYAPFVRLYTNIVGNGRWFDQVVVNLLPPGLPDIPGSPRSRPHVGG